MTDERVNVRLSADQAARLDAVAAARGISRAQALRALLDDPSVTDPPSDWLSSLIAWLERPPTLAEHEDGADDDLEDDQHADSLEDAAAYERAPGQLARASPPT